MGERRRMQLQTSICHNFPKDLKCPCPYVCRYVSEELGYLLYVYMFAGLYWASANGSGGGGALYLNVEI